MTSPSTTVSYTSDARRLRQSRTVGAVTKQFSWSSVGALPVLLDDGEHSYLYGPSSTPIGQVDDASGAVQYLHSDLLGTPRLVTSSAGAAIGTVSFDTFGNRTTQIGTQSAFGFTGNWTDPDTGLLYLRARDYDPATGQFLTVDPAVDKTRQPYAYTGNNPVSRTDPTGLDAASDAQAKADAELYGRPYILRGMLLNLVSFGTYGVQQNLCAGDDMWTALTKSYNPVYAILEGGTNAVQDIQNGESSFRIFMDVLEFGGGVIGLATIAVGGASLAGMLGRAGTVGRVGAAGGGPVSGFADASGVGYRSFAAAKADLGSPGPGNVFDHVVEQSQAKPARSGFAVEEINSPFNMNPVSGRTNQIKANYYSSKRKFSGDLIVRDWLNGQPFADQYRFGMQVLADIRNGVIS